MNKNNAEEVSLNSTEISAENEVCQSFTGGESICQSVANNHQLSGVLNFQTQATIPQDLPYHLKFGLQSSTSLQTAIVPKDEIEALLGVQMVGLHNAAMDLFAKANALGQTPELSMKYIDLANKALKTFTMQIEALNRHRGKGQQKVTVEHVTVNQGGQAVIGNIEQGGGEKKGRGNGR